MSQVASLQFLSVITASFLASSRTLSQTDSIVSSVEDLVGALEEPPSDGRVIIDAQRLRLEEPLIIRQDNLIIEGLSSRPIITCPPDQPAFIIEASGIRLDSLEFAECVGNSSILIQGVNQGVRAVDVVIHDVTFRGNEGLFGAGVAVVPCMSQFCNRSVITISSCQFEDNEALLGGSIYAQNTALFVRDSNFVRNIARSTAGSIYIGNGLHGSILNISGSNFTENTARGALEDGEVEEGVLPGRAGAIYVNSTANCTISTSRFTSNRGCLGSGAVEVINLSPDSEQSVSYQMSIDNCTFAHNQAYCQLERDDILVEDFSSPNYVGGAMSYGAIGIMDLTWTVRNCYFLDNKAHHGGALAIVGTTETEQHVLDSVFDYNQVLGGGGCILVVSTKLILSRSNLSNSQGVFGGGLVVIDQGTLTTDPDLEQGLGSVFDNNTAVYGGALFLVYTGDVSLNGLVLRNNTAFRYGGGLRYYDSPNSIKMNGVHFEGNAARVGGAAAMLGFGNLSISEHRNRRSVFQDNKSVVGGALFLEIGHFIAFFINVTHADFNGNEAMERENPFIQSLVNRDSNFSPIDGLTDEILSIIMSRSEEEDILGRMTDIDDGRGGGVCLALEPMRVYTNAEILFSSVTMTANRGIVGAGLAAFVGDFEWNNGSISTCFPSFFGLQACRLLLFQDVNMTQNEAQFAGGLFLTNPLAISNACDRFNPGMNRSLPEIMQIQTQMERNERPFSHSDLHCTYLHDNIILSNTSSTSGADVGTTVQSLELLNVEGRTLARTASRERLSVCPSNYNEVLEDCEPLEIAVKDAFGQTIERAIPDSKLEVTLQSDSITGDQRYQASEGIINITDTLAWGINTTAELTIFSDRQNDLKVSTSFSTRSCYPGEVHEDRECGPCAPDEYNFDPRDPEGCRECEEHAICSGKAALVPQDKYWHSTPFSPAFSECIIEEACVFEGRVNNLTDYYNDNLRLIEELRQLEEYFEGTGDLSPFLEYKQCNEGYDGIRCGSCVEGYGHSYNGKCEECPDERSTAEIVATVASFWVFIFLTANCLITLSSTKARIRLALEQSRASIAHPNRSLKKAPGFKKPEVRPTLVRSSTIHERNEEQDAMAIESLTQQLTATVQLIEMIKILINYFQITSTALHLHIEWVASIKWVLSIEGVIAGVAGESLIIPFECSFDQDGQVTPAIAALWVCAAVPFMVLATLIVLFLISWYFSRKRHNRQLRTPAANRLSLATCLIIFTIVSLYFSYLSIVREFLRTINCVRGEHIQHVEDTYYLRYAVHRNRVVWAEDTDLTCFEGEHLATGVAGTIGVALCLGLMLVIVWIASHRDRFSDPEFIGRYWFLYQAYRREWHTSAWEAVILLRKALIAAVVVFSVHLGPNLQASICVGILFIAQMLHTIARPYEEYPDQDNVPEYTGTSLRYLFPNWSEDWTVLNNGIGLNSLESMSLMSSIVVFFTGIILHDSYSSDKGKIIMTVFGCGVNLIFVVFVLYRMYLTVHLILDYKLETCCPSFLVNYPENGSFMSLFVKFKEVVRQRLESGTSFVEITYLNSRNVLPVVSESNDIQPGTSGSN